MSTLNKLKSKFKDTLAYDFEKAKLELVSSIVQVMERNQLTQADVARKMQVSEANVSKILRADQNLTLKTMVNLAKAINSKVEIRLISLEKSSNKTSVSSGKGVKDSNIAKQTAWSNAYRNFYKDFHTHHTVKLGRVVNSQECENDYEYSAAPAELM
jgi:plasmid maintenance system antidote protein VapI